MSEMSQAIFDSKVSLPNKLMQDDGTITDITGKEVVSSVEAYDAKPALPNKFLNPNGTYSTLNEIISETIDTELYIIVQELPTEGNPNKIYLVPKENGGFTEWHYHDGKWDTVGELEIDLSNYYTIEETNQAISNAIQQSITQVLGGEY